MKIQTGHRAALHCPHNILFNPKACVMQFSFITQWEAIVEHCTTKKGICIYLCTLSPEVTMKNVQVTKLRVWSYMSTVIVKFNRNTKYTMWKGYGVIRLKQEFCQDCSLWGKAKNGGVFSRISKVKTLKLKGRTINFCGWHHPTPKLIQGSDRILELNMEVAEFKSEIRFSPFTFV